MRIRAISTLSGIKPNFQGKWETQNITKYLHCPDQERVKRIYIPDKDEGAYSIAHAWREETGLLPIDWVKNNNPYNQIKSNIQYEIEGSPYMPLDVLEASVNIKYENTPNYARNEKIDKYIELAKIAAQVNDKYGVEVQERNMIDEMKQIYGAKMIAFAEMQINNYKHNFGTNSMHKIRNDQF